MSSISSASSSPAGTFVEDLFTKMAYQPNDAIAQSALEEDISPDFKATINTQPLTKATFIRSVLEARQAGLMTLESNRELLHVAVSAPDASDAQGKGNTAIVGNMQTFVLRFHDGARKTQRNTSLTICEVAMQSEKGEGEGVGVGKRQLVGLTEIVSSVEVD